MEEPTIRELGEESIDPDPIAQFAVWFADAGAAGIAQPEGMALGTVDEDGSPSVRIVLLKQYDTRGFVFFTNYESRKGRALAGNPRAALTFWWDPLERQVRIEGVAERVSAAESDEYYRTRPLGSRIGAWASPQSSRIESRGVLEQRVREVEKQFEGKDEPPRPAFWGGYRVIPDAIEFWQGRVSRLHDRIRYVRENDAWRTERLAP